MITLIQRLIDQSEDRILIGSGVVIAANAGGAWTPIGDVTTTMLWIGDRLTTLNIIDALFLPSVACTIVSLICLSCFLKGSFPDLKNGAVAKNIAPLGKYIFFLGSAY